MNFKLSEEVPRFRTYPELGPELQFENDPEVLRKAFLTQGLILPQELLMPADPHAEVYDEWKELLTS